MKERGKGTSLGRKMGVLVLGILLLTGAVVFWQYENTKEQKRYEDRTQDLEQKDRKTETKTAEQTEEQKQEKEETNEEKSVQDTSQEEAQTPFADITNLSAFATPVMGMYDGLLKEALSSWITEYELEAETGEILTAVTPQDDPQTTEFYLKLDDAKGSLVKLTWHPRERVVTASQCGYTQEEIEAGIGRDNGPKSRDITPQEEEQFLREQEEAAEQAEEQPQPDVQEQKEEGE